MRSIVTTSTTSDIKVVVIGVDNNISLNNYTIINKSIRKEPTNSAYNRELDNGSIWSTTGIDKSDQTII